jgi:hypothetical protein
LENLLFPLFFCLSAPSILVSLWRADTLFEAVTVQSDLGREAREFATIPAQQARPTVGLQRNNPARRHSGLGYLSPIAYEEMMQAEP